MRYDYPLNEDSLVFDVGGFNGEFAKGIVDKYGCKVHLFEPVFWNTIPEIPGVRVNKYGLAGSNTARGLHIKGNATSLFGRGVVYDAEFVTLKDYMAINDINFIDLIKINIEGMEYELLCNMVNSGLMSKINHIQVQFHKLPEQESFRDLVCEDLSITHKLDWGYDWIWESWSKK